MSSPNSSFHNDPNYESAVQDLQQEKKMVAALKRLSIGHMMNYDPDLPPGTITMDDIDPFSTYNSNNNNNSTTTTTNINNGLHDEDSISPMIPKKPSTRSTSRSSSRSGTPSLSSSPPSSPQRKPSQQQQQQQQQHFHQEPQTPPYNKSPSPIKRRSFHDNSSVLTSESHDVFFDAEDEVYDATSNLMWVPATAHPQVNPESFKKLIKNQVEEILERKLSRKSSLSRKSTLSRSSSTSTKETLTGPDDSEDTTDSHKDTPLEDSSPPTPPSTSTKPLPEQQKPVEVQTPQPKEQTQETRQSSKSPSPPKRDASKRESWYNNDHTKRYSNPSLRELTSELEQLSKMAGMDKNDAVTIARTLSAQSLGYTDVERLAFDELDGNQSPSSPGSPGSFDHGSSGRTSTLHLQQRLQQQFQQAQLKAEREAVERKRGNHYLTRQHPQGQLSPPNDVTESQHHHTTTTTGGNPLSGDFTLKRSRRTDYRKKEYESRSRPPTHSPPTIRKYNVRDSQLLFNYKKPVESSQQQPPPQPSKSSGHRLKNKKSQTSLEAAISNSIMDGTGMASNPYPTASSSIDFGKLATKKSSKTLANPDNYKESKSRSKSRLDPQSYKSDRHVLPQHQHQHQQQLPPQQQNGPYQQYNQSSSSTRHRTNSGQQMPIPEKHHHRSDNRRIIPSASNTNINDFMVQSDSFQNHHRRQERSHRKNSQPQPQPHHNEQEQAFRSSSKNSGSRKQYQQQQQQQLHQPYQNGAVPGKSHQLHQNLDKLRSEINEFKESLNKSDPTLVHKQSKGDLMLQQNGYHSSQNRYREAQHPDASFDISYNDLTAEDPLGIEQQVRHELNKEGSPELSMDDTFDEDLEVSPIKDHASEFKLDTDILEGIPLVENTFLDLSDEEDEVDHIDSHAGHMARNRQRRAQSPPPQYSVQDEVSHNHDHTVTQAKPVQLEDGFGTQPLPSPTLRLDENTQTPPHSRKTSNGANYDDYYNIGEKQSTPSTPKIKKESKVKTKLFNKDPNLEIIDSDNYQEKMGLANSASKKLKKKKSFGILGNNIVSESTDNDDSAKKLKKKKSWGWLRERSASASTVDTTNLPPLPVDSLPPRSFSNPEATTSHQQQQQLLEQDQDQQDEHVMDNSSLNDTRSSHDIHSIKSTDKENVLSKFFKKKAKVPGNSAQSVFSFESKDSGVTVDYESDNDSKTLKKKGSSNSLFKKKSKAKLSERDNVSNRDILRPLNLVSDESQIKSHGSYNLEDKENLVERNIEYQDEYDEQQPLTSSPVHQFNLEHLKDDFATLNEQDESRKGNETQTGKSTITMIDEDESRGGSNLENLNVDELSTKKSGNKRKKHSKKVVLDSANEQTAERVSSKQVRDSYEEEEVELQGESAATTATTNNNKSEEKERLDIQEKLKKSIKRTSKANQPIEFTDSAFGFPLPPPSQSTLIMLDYRFPVHVERAIYRLSHLKLANPKRSLREQVLLSNFMYAYLNLVDHTLHLEQQNMSSEDGENIDSGVDEISDRDDKDMIFADSNIMVDDDIVPVESNDDSIAFDLDMSDVDELHSDERYHSSIEV